MSHSPTHRPRGEHLNMRIFPAPDAPDMEACYVQMPQILRTHEELVVIFGTRKLLDSSVGKLASERSELTWALSKNDGFKWSISNHAPGLGRLIQTTYGVPLKNSGMSTITYPRPKDRCLSLLQGAQVGWAPYHNDLPTLGSEPIQNMGPYQNFWFQEMIAETDGKLLAGGLGLKTGKPLPTDSRITNRGTEAYFLRSANGGRSFVYHASIPNPEGHCLGAFGLIAGEHGYALAILEATSEPEGTPADFLYSSYSINYGKSWSAPEPIEVTGRSPTLVRLRNGTLVMISITLSDPCSVQTVLSEDDGATWKIETLRGLHRDDPLFGGFGNPKAIQLSDGTIACTYHGHTVEPTTDRFTPGGVYISLFDEDWIRKGEM